MDYEEVIKQLKEKYGYDYGEGADDFIKDLIIGTIEIVKNNVDLAIVIVPKETLCECKEPKDEGWYDDARKCHCGGIYFE